jgi:hypothetical protein
MRLVSQPSADGVVNKHGHLHIPARGHRAAGIGGGNRILLTTDLTREFLLAIPENVLD